MSVILKSNVLNPKKTWPLVFTLIGFMLGLVPGIVQVQRMRDQVRAAIAAEENNAAETERLRKIMRDAAAYYRGEIAEYQQLANIRPSNPGKTEKAVGMTCTQEFGPAYGAGSGVRSWRPRADGRCYMADAR